MGSSMYSMGMQSGSHYPYSYPYSNSYYSNMQYPYGYPPYYQSYPDMYMQQASASGQTSNPYPNHPSASYQWPHQTGTLSTQKPTSQS